LGQTVQLFPAAAIRARTEEAAFSQSAQIECTFFLLSFPFYHLPFSLSQQQQQPTDGSSPQKKKKKEEILDVVQLLKHLHEVFPVCVATHSTSPSFFVIYPFSLLLSLKQTTANRMPSQNLWVNLQPLLRCVAFSLLSLSFVCVELSSFLLLGQEGISESGRCCSPRQATCQLFG
jgi:hypothetical protein